MGKVTVFFIVILLLIGCTIQNTILQFWIDSFPKEVGGPYFILSWASLLFTIFFGILYGIALLKKPNTVPIRNYWKSYLIQGATNMMFGICLVYSAPISRTPPIIFVVLVNFAIVFGMFLTKFLIK